MKERLDIILVKRNLAPSREKAKAMIMSGCVFVDGQREDKAGTSFPEDIKIEIHGNTLRYVSRGVFSSVCRIRSVWISAPQPEDLQTVCFKTAPQKFTRWMWAMDSSPGNCVRIPG